MSGQIWEWTSRGIEDGDVWLPAIEVWISRKIGEMLQTGSSNCPAGGPNPPT